MRCAIYTRVSTDEQAQPNYNSLQLQAELCEHYLEVHREQGWVVAGLYEDAGYSGKDLNRPALQRLLRDVRRGDVQVVVAYKLDRVSRSLRDFYEFWGVLQAAEAIFVSATQSFDTSAPAGNLMLNVLLSFAQFERETTAERTAAKMRARAQKGLWNGGYVPYGYAYDRSQQLLLPDGDEAPIVARVFREFVRLGSAWRVCEELNREGLRTRSRVIGRAGNPRQVGNTPFRPDTIRSLLQNPIYIGLIRCQGETFPGRHEPLIPPALFEQANALLADRQSSPRRSSQDQHVHLLKGLVRCGDCGSTMTPYPSGKIGKEGERYLYYVCTAVLRDQRGCPCQVRRLPVRRLERAIAVLLSSLADAPAVLSSHLRRCTATDRKELQSLSSRRANLLSSLQDIERQLSALVAHFGKDEVPVYVSEEIVRLDEQREEIRKEIGTMEARIEELREGTVSEEELLERLSVLSRGFEGLSLQEQKAILQGIVGRIEVDVETPSVPNDRQGKSRRRTRRLLLNISLRSSPPLEGRRPRICAVVPCWGDLDSSRVATEFVLHHGIPAETTSAVIPAPPAKPQETPEERALRFQRMLNEVGSRAELARQLGVARSWVTQVLQRLPASS